MINTDKMANRHREIIRLIAWGRSNKEIARILKISSKTVEKHRMNLKEQYSITNTADITRFAIRHGILTLDEIMAEGITPVKI